MANNTIVLCYINGEMIVNLKYVIILLLGKVFQSTI